MAKFTGFRGIFEEDGPHYFFDYDDKDSVEVSPVAIIAALLKIHAWEVLKDEPNRNDT